METLSWTKYTYVCDPDECDSLIEYTCSDKFGFPSGSVMNITCPCGRKPQLLSSESATIDPFTKTNERQEMDISTASSVLDIRETMKQEMELLYGNEITELKNKLDAETQRTENYRQLVSNANSQLGKIIDNLTEDYWYSDSTDKEEILTELCEILDHQPVKEVSFEATIRVSGRMNVSLGEDYDVEDMLSDISVDIYNGDVVFDDISLDSVEEM